MHSIFINQNFDICIVTSPWQAQDGGWGGGGLILSPPGTFRTPAPD